MKLWIILTLLPSILIDSTGGQILDISTETNGILENTTSATNATINVDSTTVFVITDNLEVSTSTPEEAIPDDYLNWFFYHSFKKLDDFFEREDERERKSDHASTIVQNTWKTRVSKVLLKLVLIILGLVGMILFICGIFIFMFLLFILCKFIGHLFQCHREQQRYKMSSRTYHVTI